MEILHQQLSDKLIELAIEVQKELGVGFLERVYENSLVVALQDETISVDQQKHLNVYFRGRNVGIYVADLVVDDKIIVEIKAVESLSKAHYAQAINYLQATDVEVAYVINFGKIPLQFKRLVKPNKQKPVAS
ncbi:MAG: GxxExxY protein [Candidatus Marinimicrobia bacterium]|nr:GxxExxY protein [Candidatus Neomarinimicrobiota bacterium]MCF7850256.1 GxxExxY protein [Candidatus Neomarinimicrobiota bacterium]MCF7903847.1 GxxExxY protein [Candidatus Neomarinimicrobiota bacterium]